MLVFLVVFAGCTPQTGSEDPTLDKQNISKLIEASRVANNQQDVEGWLARISHKK